MEGRYHSSLTKKRDFVPFVCSQGHPPVAPGKPTPKYKPLHKPGFRSIFQQFPSSEHIARPSLLTERLADVLVCPANAQFYTGDVREALPLPRMGRGFGSGR